MNNPDNPSPSRVTLMDISKALGISHTTVSLALKKHPRISEATRARVEAKANEMGYKPDPLFAALAQYRKKTRSTPISGTLAWINTARDPEQPKSFRDFNLYYNGAKEAAATLGYHLEEFSVAKTPLHRLNSIFQTRNIRGLLLAPLYDPTFDWQHFPWKHYATVNLSRSITYPKTHLVTTAQTTNTILAFERAQAKGYRRIGFACDYIHSRFFALGYTWAQKELPPDRQLPVLMLTEADDPASQQALLEQWILKEKPDAIYLDTTKVNHLLRSLKPGIYENIGLIASTTNDLDVDAGIDQNGKEIGRNGVRTLVSLLNEHLYGIPAIRTEILVEGTWVDGTSLPDRS